MESLWRTGESVPDHWEVHLATTMEEVLLERLERGQEDRLELVVEAAADGEEAPMGVTPASEAV